MADNKTSIVISAEDKTQAALASVRNGLKGMETAFAGLDNVAGRIPLLGTALASAFGAISFTGIVKGAIDAADELNDLSQKLGISVEDLSGFKFAAEQSGTSLEGVARGVKALSRSMADDGEKLKAAGITATDATTALIQLADAFAQMPDGIEKTAIAMELMGKSGADMIPLLNGGGEALRKMLEEGQRLNPITAEMAKQADAFNDSLGKLKTTAGGVGIAIANELLPTLNALSEKLAQAFAGGVVEGFTSRWSAAFKGMAAGINEAMAASEEFLAKITFGNVAELHLKKALEYRDAAKRIYAELSALAPAAPGGAAASTTSAGKFNLPSLLEDKGKAKAAKKLKPFDPEGDFFAAVDESLLKAQKKAADDAAAAAEKYDDALKKAAGSLYAATDAGRFDELNRKLAQAQEAFAAGYLNQQQLDAVNASLFETTKELEKQKSIGEELGLTFASAFEDAIVGGKKFSEVLQGLAQDIQRILVRKTITEPMGELFSGLAKSFDISKLWPFANGGVMTGAGPLALQ